VNQSVTVIEDTAKAITLVATDAEGSALTYRIVSAPVRGSLSGAAPNVTYTPDTGYVGADSFTFWVNDGTDDSNVATVSLDVQAVPVGPVPVIWTDLIGVEVIEDTITKTAGAGWGSGGAASSRTISADGGVEFVANETNGEPMCGLSAINKDAGYKTIEYAIYFYTSSKFYIFEKGINKGQFGDYSVGDRFGVERSGTAILYKKNGTVFYTSTVPSTGSLLVDATIHDRGGIVASANIFGLK
jgi:hypothetical protein